MKELVVSLATVFAALSLPVMYLIEWKYKRSRTAHAVLASLGAVSLAAVCVLFSIKVRSATGDVRGWAEDFFYPYFVRAVVFDAVLTGLFCLAAAIGHSMKRTRIALSALLPIGMILVTLFMKTLASGGQFAVDFYIGALAPGLGLLCHAVPLCEKGKKTD